MRNKKEKSNFKKFLKIYIAILTTIMIGFLIYVADSLIKYENNQIDNYIENLIEELQDASKKGKIEKYINTSDLEINKLENKGTTISQGFKELLNTEEITYKINSEKEQIYDIFVDGKLALQVKLNDNKKENRLGLLSFTKWETESVEMKMEKGVYTCGVLVPNNYEVYINGNKLTQSDITEKVQEEGLAQISEYVEIPYIVKYEITNLLKKPEVKILNENKNSVNYEWNENTITEQLNFEKVEKLEETKGKIQGDVDILKIAKDWSLYLTDDLEGKLHGFYNISKYLIKDSSLYKYAYKWAVGEDITFVSSHTLQNPAFTDEKISNFEIYNSNAFSCEVYLQKNMRLKSSGRKIEDTMHEKMYFAYYDETQDGKNNPTWKLVNMQSVTDNK